ESVPEGWELECGGWVKPTSCQGLSQSPTAGGPDAGGVRVPKAHEGRRRAPGPGRDPPVAARPGLLLRPGQCVWECAVLLQPEMEKRHVRVIVELGRSFSDANAPKELYACREGRHPAASPPTSSSQCR